MMHMGFGLIWILLPGLLLIYGGYRLVSRLLHNKRAQIPGHQSDSGSAAISDADIFRLAQQKGGELSVSDVILGLNASRQEAEQKLTSLCDGLHVTMEVQDNGRVYYRFPELLESGNS